MSGSKFIAKTFAGLENVLAIELKGIGAKNVFVLRRAVEFTGDKEIMYKANYLCRTALRILKPIAEFEALNEDQLYDEVKKINWEDYLSIDKTFAVDGITFNSNINHSKYLALKTKDAIVDQFREKYEVRPNVNTFNPDLSINVRISRDKCTISTDSSGESLFKRGYRQVAGLAPINEVLAAGLVQLSGWDKNSNFIDPMCGSATIPIEAALFALNIPAGYFREEYAFKRWSDFDKELWEKVKTEANAQRTEFNHSIIASDWSGRVMTTAKENIEFAEVSSVITQKTDFFESISPPENGGVLIMNPPYGQRMKLDDIQVFYKKIGDTLKKNFNGYDAWIISSDVSAIKRVGLRPDKRIKLYNGPLESSFYKFGIYEGTKKESTFKWDDDKPRKTFDHKKREQSFSDDSPKKQRTKPKTDDRIRDLNEEREMKSSNFKDKKDDNRKPGRPDWKERRKEE